jgi:hypothetical protein
MHLASERLVAGDETGDLGCEKSGRKLKQKPAGTIGKPSLVSNHYVLMPSVISRSFEESVLWTSSRIYPT